MIQEYNNPAEGGSPAGCLIGFIICIIIGMLCGCKTVQNSVITSDSISSVKIDKTQGIKVSSSDKYQERTTDKFHLLVLNERGDTVKEKEYIYVSDTRIEAYKDSVVHLRELYDSLSRVKQQYIKYTVTEKLPFWKKLMADWAGYIIGVLLLLLIAQFIRHKITNIQTKRP